MLLVSWAETMLIVGSRFFQSGAVDAKSNYTSATPGSSPEQLDHPQSLRGCNFGALWSTETHSTFLERSWIDC